MKLLCVLDQEQKWCTVSNPGMDYTHVVEQCDAACEKGGETDFVFVFCFVALRFVCLVFFYKNRWKQAARNKENDKNFQ